MSKQRNSERDLRCSNCGLIEFPRTKINGRWVCDPCNRSEPEADDLDIEGYEERRRQRLAEAQEY